MNETGEMFTRGECESYFREQVRAAGGAKKWLRKNKVYGKDHVLHMIEDGRLFNDEQIRARLGFSPIERWMAIPPSERG